MPALCELFFVILKAIRRVLFTYTLLTIAKLLTLAQVTALSFLRIINLLSLPVIALVASKLLRLPVTSNAVYSPPELLLINLGLFRGIAFVV